MYEMNLFTSPSLIYVGMVPITIALAALVMYLLSLITLHTRNCYHNSNNVLDRHLNVYA
jgi:hypothetical protein